MVFFAIDAPIATPIPAAPPASTDAATAAMKAVIEPLSVAETVMAPAWAIVEPVI
jgi:hypothetical protein